LCEPDGDLMLKIDHQPGWFYYQYSWSIQKRTHSEFGKRDGMDGPERVPEGCRHYRE